MSDEAKKPLYLRLSSTVVKQVDYYAVDRDIFRSQAVEELLKRGLDRSGVDDSGADK